MPKIFYAIKTKDVSLIIIYLFLFFFAAQFQRQHTLKRFEQSLVEPEMWQLVTIDKKLTKDVV